MKTIIFKTVDAKYTFRNELVPSEQHGFIEMVNIVTQPSSQEYTQHEDNFKIKVSYDVTDITENTIVVDNINVKVIQGA